MVLGSQTVDTISRFKGSDLTYHMEDCLYLFYIWEPYLFSPAGALRLRALASEQARRYGDSCSAEDTIFHLITYGLMEHGLPNFVFIVLNSRYKYPNQHHTNTTCGNPRSDSHKRTVAGTLATSSPSGQDEGKRYAEWP